MYARQLLLKLYSRWESSRNSGFLDLLYYNPRASILDLGCGDGRFTIEIAEAIGSKNVFCIEIDEKAIVDASRRGIKVVKHDLNCFPYPFDSEGIDVIVSNQVIEHLYYPIKFLKEVYRILKPGGYAVISTENLASWDNMLALILGYTPFSMEFDEGIVKLGNHLSPHNREIIKGLSYPHVRIFTLKGLIEALELVGFRIEKVVGSGHIIPIRLFEELDRRHCRFITIKARKSNKKELNKANNI